MLVSSLPPHSLRNFVNQASTVKNVAALARLTIEESDIEQVTQEFNQTIELFNTLIKVDTENIAPMVNPTAGSQRLRTDTIETLVDRKGLMQNAPTKECDYFLVPKVID